MVHRDKTELGQVASPTGIQVAPSHFTHGQNNKPVRQFTSRSRTKSTASFKGLRKVLTHDGTTIDRDPMKSTKSSDALFRKRTISGLNMTALARVRSNPNVHGGIGGSHVVNSHSNASGMWMGIAGLKPRRTKSIHSVVHIENPNDSDSDSERAEFITDKDDKEEEEEVEYFTDDEPSTESNKEGGNLGETDSMDKGRIISIDSIMEEAHTKEEKDNLVVDEQSSIKHLNYKVPSKYVDDRSAGISQDKLSGNMQGLDIISSSAETEKLVSDSESDNDKVVTLKSSEDNGLSISNDRIERMNLQDDDDDIESQDNQLTRQTKKNVSHTQEQNIPVNEKNHSDMDNIQASNSLADQYIPDMILSQSTGVEKRFDEPPSIQNSFSNELHGESAAMYNNDIDNTINMGPETFKGASYLSGSVRPKMQQIPKHISDNIQEFNVANAQLSQTKRSNIAKNDQNVKITNFSNSYSSLTNNLQRANAAAGIGKANTRHNPSSRGPNSSAGSNSGSTPLSHLFQKKKTAPTLGDHQGKTENGTDGSDGSKINNFSQFLKSDMSEGDSRTQRKLWLQRENSIMDLSVQNVSSGSLFMVTNVDVKREFERISHEYTNSRRFYNPLDASLDRYEANQRQQEDKDKTNITNSKSRSKSTSNKNANRLPTRSTHSNNEFFANYGSSRSNNINIEEYLPKSQSSKLHRILSSLWEEESMEFNHEANPLSKVAKSYHHREPSDSSSRNRLAAMNSGSRLVNNNNYLNNMSQNGPARHSLRNAIGNTNANTSSTGQQRVRNTLQPTTRAVNKRMESVNQQQVQRY